MGQLQLGGGPKGFQILFVTNFPKFSWLYNRQNFNIAAMKLAYEELEAKLAQTQELLRIALEEIQKLKEQINRNSKNSSKPPSTDQKVNTGSTDYKKKRRGREGKARMPFPAERVNRHILCSQENCPHCGSNSIQLSNQPPEVLQQAELPDAQAIVTEYTLLKYGCGTCGKNSIASLPEGIPDSAFGPKLMGLLATLTGVCHLAKREAAQLIKDLYGVDIGIGSVPNIEERVAEALEPIYRRIHHFVIESKFCKHFDETGWRDSGKRHFVWLATCEHAAFYMVDRRRSGEAFKKLIGKEASNLAAVTDRYGVYNTLGKIHQYCLAHLIREFKRYAERDGPDKAIGRALEKELKTVCRIHRDYRRGKLSLEQRDKRLKQRKRKAELLLEDGMANGSDQLYGICENLLDNFDKLWTFMHVPGMEPTNNLAERDLRKLVIWRKKSYGTRSERGKKFVERVTSVAQTVKKQGKNVLCFIQEAVANFYCKLSAPFVSEAMGF
jgi:transposase